MPSRRLLEPHVARFYRFGDPFGRPFRSQWPLILDVFVRIEFWIGFWTLLGARWRQRRGQAGGGVFTDPDLEGSGYDLIRLAAGLWPGAADPMRKRRSRHRAYRGQVLVARISNSDGDGDRDSHNYGN